jgi:hypothetical protein
VSESTSPRASRFAPPRWLDARFALGVLLVLVSVVVGARVLSAADNTTPVYVAAHDLVPGEHVADGDLAVTHVRLADRGSYYVAATGSMPAGYVVTRFVAGGELVPAAALAATAPGADRLVTVPVEPGHLPDELGRGDLVDVYVTPHAGAGGTVPAPTLVATALPVEEREGGARTFSANAALSVVLSVPAGEVPRLVHAIEAGTVDLVVLPPTAAAQRTVAPTPAPTSS